jgi:integrase/recombinase XerC
MPDIASIQQFINYLRFEKRYSQHTITAYSDDLTQFSNFIHQQYGETSINGISSSLVRTWLASLKEDDLKAKSIRRKVSSLSSFFRYHLRIGTLQKTPMVNISTPKIPKRLPGYVEEADITRLLESGTFGEDWNSKTDHLLISIFYQTGLRLSELITLKESHINIAGKTVKVLGKGNKERIIPISATLASDLEAYLSAKRKLFEINPAATLLVNSKGKKLYSKYVYLAVKKYLGKVTTLEKRSPHILRHTFATHLTGNGANLNSIKELLGHTSLAATQIYTHNSIDKLKDAHKKAHPKG